MLTASSTSSNTPTGDAAEPTSPPVFEMQCRWGACNRWVSAPGDELHDAMYEHLTSSHPDCERRSTEAQSCQWTKCNETGKKQEMRKHVDRFHIKKEVVRLTARG
jgi:hypothetical protein